VSGIRMSGIQITCQGRLIVAFIFAMLLHNCCYYIFVLLQGCRVGIRYLPLGCLASRLLAKVG